MRVHLIQSAVDAEYADGGFAIRTEQQGQEMQPDMVCRTENAVKCAFPWGNAGAVCMAGTGEPRLVRPFPNTNIMYGSTVIPTIYFRLNAGTHCIADYFYGDGSFLDKGRAIALPQFFYAQGCVRKLAVSLHASRATSREKRIEILFGEEKIVIEF